MPLNEDAARAIAACLCEEGCAAPVMAHLDAVLAWMIQPERPSSRPLDDALLAAGLAREQAIERAYRLLDERLLGVQLEAPEETLGLMGETDPGVIKQRYRRLISVYHPDRHPARSADLNQRTERINRAYRLLMQRHAGVDAEWTGGGARSRSSRPSVRASPVPPAWTSPVEDLDGRPPRGLHAQLLWGVPARRDASLIQRRLIQAMVLGCAALLAILLLDKDPPDEAHGTRPPVVAQPIAAPVAQALEPSPSPLPIGPSPGPLKSPYPFAEPAPEMVAPPAALFPLEVLLAAEPEPAPEVVVPPASLFPLEVLLASETSPKPAQERQPPSEPVPVYEPLRHLPVAETPPNRVPAAESRAVPTIAKATPAPKTVQVPALVDTDACAGVSDVLGRFRQAYQTGSADRLANLFTLDARERGTTGRASIRRLYADWFASTSGRTISFARASTQSVGKDLCRIRVRFDVGYHDTNGRARSQTGQIRALFKRDGGRTLIQELTH
ncbi:DnaJ domain-containing protein [Thiocapsa roseopersicina]|uniref:DnaJ domain-containing protein n=1 Tax=Thiocapsa roseopersicina TaxID=1058 RepID=A0A1H2QE78_THIRO|nr:DnaJ domain-containing protein [Thiocapsa roseopersicina]SDW05432.1 DnaJ domain-containing protein [Thiocapsa roseopersicina]